MAPMEGITNYVYRNAYHHYFHPMDKYFTPFLAGKRDKRLSLKEEREVSPDTNKGLYVVPQILSNNGEDVIQLARLLMDYGHREINLNLGCPSGTVTAKGKGAGFLEEPVKLERFLDEIFSKLDIKISVKTRIGIEDGEEWEPLLKLYNRFPLEELIVHPRFLVDYYKNKPHLWAYQLAQEISLAPLCYNGDLFTPEAYEALAGQFPGTDTFMYGRGLIANPFLVGQIRENQIPGKETLKSFHDEIYQEYQETLSGDRNVLFRMKELWAHMIASFEGSEKHMKKIRKSQKCREYEAVVAQLFAECPFRGSTKEEIL